MTVTAAAGNPAPLLGGILIGLASSFKLATTGRVAGISGIVGGLVRGSFDTWRVAFVSGLLAGGALLTQLLPAALAGAIPATLTTTRALTAGLLVGLGTSLGSGCTSGHGVCGLARLSLRSLAAVMTFMATGAVTATVFDTAALVGATTSPVWPTPTTLLALSDPVVLQVGGVAAAALGGLAALLWLVRDAIPSTVRADVAEFASGLVFAIGLGISGMLQPAKVAAFLTPLGKAFDPSLMGVMGGALLVTTPSFQLMTRLKKSPSCATSLSLPTTSIVDVPLILGATLFGAGWGLAGMCPGPALVNLMQPSTQGVAVVAAMVVGMLLTPVLSSAISSSPLAKDA